MTVIDRNSAAVNSCKTFVSCVYTFMLVIDLGVKLLNHRVYISSAFVDASKQLSEVVKRTQTPVTVCVCQLSQIREAEHPSPRVCEASEVPCKSLSLLKSWF